MYSCLFCGNELTEEEAAEVFCYGCASTICQDCNYDPGLGGEHDPYEHRRIQVTREQD